MRALSALTLPTFDVELLTAVPGTLTCSTFPDVFHDDFLAATVRARLTHLALPYFFGMPPAGAPRLAVLDSTSGLVAALAPGRPLHSATLRVANTVYDGFSPATLFYALGRALKVLILVLAPNVDVAHARAVVRRARKYRRGARASRAVSSDEISLQALYKQVSSLLSNVGRRAGASRTPPADHASDRGCQGGRRPVASSAVEVTSAEIGIKLRRISFGGALETRAGAMN